jgi:cyclopropane fatty-acyl-phospholipid synthase-like methyltransferase
MQYKQTNIQADQYKFPYHYIPEAKHWPFLSRHWSFSASYVAALEMISEVLTQTANKLENTHSHIDIGCGDGALIHHLARNSNLAKTRFSGIDFDENSIRWARMFNPGIDFQARDLTDVDKTYCSATLIEVIEHIPPADLPRFIENAGRVVRPGGLMIITVPSIEKRVTAKHFQHFSPDSIRTILEPVFKDISIKFFERHNIISKLISILLDNEVFKVDAPILNRRLINQLRRHYAEGNKSGRIFVTCTPR